MARRVTVGARKYLNCGPNFLAATLQLGSFMVTPRTAHRPRSTPPSVRQSPTRLVAGQASSSRTASQPTRTSQSSTRPVAGQASTSGSAPALGQAIRPQGDTRSPDAFQAPRLPLHTPVLDDEARHARATLANRLAGASALAGPNPSARQEAAARAAAEVFSLADRLSSVGRHSEAREVLATFADSTLAQERTSATQGLRANTRTRYATLRIAENPMTYRELAQNRMEQASLNGEASRLLGRVANLERPQDARAFFEQAALRRSPDELRGVFADYARTFYVHSGNGADWTNNMSPSIRASSFDRLTWDLPRDRAGRTVIDCEGYGMLAERMLGRLRDRSGREVFQVQHALATDASHVIATVTDRSNRSFIVNNDDVSPFRDAREHQGLIHSQMTRRRGEPASDRTFTFGLSIDQAHTNPHRDEY